MLCTVGKVGEVVVAVTAGVYENHDVSFVAVDVIVTEPFVPVTNRTPVPPLRKSVPFASFVKEPDRFVTRRVFVALLKVKFEDPPKVPPSLN